MASDWAIRDGGRDDLPALESLWRSMYEHHGAVSSASLPFIPADERWGVRSSEFERTLQDGTGLFLVADAGGETVGVAFSTLLAPDPIFGRGPVGELETLVVASDRRGQGIGEALARRSIAVLRERGAKTLKIVVVAGNEGALRLYRRLGVEPALVELMAPL